MARRPTLQDVAREAGLSIATVNRVVAAAPGVREDTARRVAEAAQEFTMLDTLVNQDTRRLT
ncbi:LacI family DNA-binding transcriptional regulator [Sagittula sp. S175]|uniref:LacI family DNA-binding transcriptional regulator n=1 Tax=Sagittula sp. S175 TaxID=3415129 RepID=UPI003C7DF9B1